MLSVSVLGLGRVGGALSIKLARRGYRIASVSGTSSDAARRVLDLIDPRPEFQGPDDFDHAGADIVLLAVRDDQIAGAAAFLAERAGLSGKVVLHTSGSRDSGLLDPLRVQGAETGSLHPLVSISDPVSGSEGFEGAFFCVEGTEGAVAAAKDIASALGGKPFEVPTEKKPLYHAAAVMACGHLVALLDQAVETLSLCGPEREEAMEIFLPLVSSTIKNLSRQTAAEALTGTFARGDAETFRAHVEALREHASDEILETYLRLGERSLEIARRGGPGGEKVEALLGEVRKEMLKRT